MKIVIQQYYKLGVDEDRGNSVQIQIANPKMKNPNSVEEDLENIDESELKPKKNRFKWLWLVTAFMIFIVIIYYVF